MKDLTILRTKLDDLCRKRDGLKILIPQWLGNTKYLEIVLKQTEEAIEGVELIILMRKEGR